MRRSAVLTRGAALCASDARVTLKVSTVNDANLVSIEAPI